MPNSDDALYQHAIKLLAIREHSSAELQLKLRQRGYSIALIHEVIAKLVQEGLQSEQRFTEMYVQMRKQRGYGPLRIRAELYERGVASAIIDDFLKDSHEQWLSLALKVKQKKFGHTKVADRLNLAKQKRFLQYRGFDVSIINLVFSEK